MDLKERDVSAIEEAIRKCIKAFVELKREIMKAWSEAVGPLEELAEAIQRAFEKNEEHMRILRRAPKWYAKVNKPAVIASRCVVWRCRNNC